MPSMSSRDDDLFMVYVIWLVNKVRWIVKHDAFLKTKKCKSTKLWSLYKYIYLCG